MQINVDVTKARVSVSFNRPAAKKPLAAPVKESALAGIEQFVGPVEVMKTGMPEIAVTAEKEKRGKLDWLPDLPKFTFAAKTSKPAKYRTFQIIPHHDVKNESVHEFVDVIAETYRELYKRVTGAGLRDPDRVFFETKVTKSAFQTFITTNADLFETVQERANMTWHHVTLQEAVDPVVGIDRKKTICHDMRMRRPFFLALKTDQRMQEKPLPQLLELARTMNDGDTILIQYGWQAAENNWARFAEKEREKFEQKRPDWWSKDRKISAATTMKTGYSGFDFVVRIAVTSVDQHRRERLARGITAALKQLNNDNELKERRVWLRKKRWIKHLQQRVIRAPLRTKRRNIVTSHEIGQFCKLPQKALQQAHRNVIENVVRPEVALTNELFTNVKGIEIGIVIEKGVKRTARVPLVPYELQTKDGNEQISQKYVDDAYCGTEFSFGEMGAGKTGEALHRAYSAITNGQTVFFFDTADGAAVRELHDALPANYPDEKIIHIDLTNKAWPVALKWSFSPQVSADDDAELQAEAAREAGRIFLRQFVDGISQDEFTDRMGRYLATAARAAGSSPLEIELTLNSPAFREELLALDEVAAELDLVTTLEALQNKARRGSESSTAEGILSRLSKLSEDKFRTNLFYQEPKVPLDFRKYADNYTGGYGYCVTIYCDKNSFGADGQEMIMTYMLAKVLLEGAYSRIDIDQHERKPFVVILDEPHRFIKGQMATKLGEDAAVELRKYRCKLVMMGHSRAQLGKLWDSFKSGGVQVTMYKSKDVQAFRDLAAVIAPLDPEEAWTALGKHEAVVTRKLPSKAEVSFICKMAKPPEKVKDRSARREACARQFGRHWKEVSEEIRARRLEYAQKDQLWYEVQEAIAEQEKEARKQARKQKADKSA